MWIKDETKEKINELKELVSKLDNQRVDFWDEEEREYMWNGETIEECDVNIFNGSAWYYDDDIHVKSIFVEDDQLYFEAFWVAYNYKGNPCEDDILHHLEPEFVVERYWNESQEKAFVETLEFFISLLKGE